MTKSRFLIQCIAAGAILTVLPVAGYAQQKTAKACEAEWRANKAAIQGAHKTKKAFIVECRSGTGQTAAAPAPATTIPATPQETPKVAPRKAAREPALRRERRTAISTGAGEFATEQEARAHCPGDTVVWANTRSKVYHFAGTRSYGGTRKGAYMCERDTVAAGIRSAKNEKRPR
jgi:hypothetical protein